MLRKNWWKILTVMLLSYSLLAGMLIPLGSGIRSVSFNGKITSGQQVLIVANTYNADYTSEEGTIQGRLRLNEKQAICSRRVFPESDNKLVLMFDIPEGKLPISRVSTGENKKSIFPILEVVSPAYGRSSLENALYIDDSAETVNADSTRFCRVVKYPDSAGLKFPFINILEESARNLYYHVPLWFGMMFIMLISVIYSGIYLSKGDLKADSRASSLALVGVIFGILGVVTGAFWAKYTWNAYWSWDIKQNTSAVLLLIYLAYFVLRNSFDDLEQRARIGAVYNIFAFASLIPLLFVIPRLYNSLHPGMDGNPAFSSYDLDNAMRLVFYPSVIAWTMLGFWMANLLTRTQNLKLKLLKVL